MSHLWCRSAEPGGLFVCCKGPGFTAAPAHMGHADRAQAKVGEVKGAMV